MAFSNLNRFNRKKATRKYILRVYFCNTFIYIYFIMLCMYFIDVTINVSCLFFPIEPIEII